MRGGAGRRMAAGLLALAMQASVPRDSFGQEPCNLTAFGQVLDSDMATPVAGVRVRAQGRATSTDQSGAFRLEGLCDGSTVVTATEPRYRVETRVVTLPRTEPLVIRLVYRMTSVVIRPPPALEMPASGLHEALDGAALDARRGLTLGAALEGVLGVRVLRSGTIAKPVIDGFSGNRVLIVNDGVRHYAQLWGLDHAPELDPFSAEQLRVVRGAAGVRYGADALGGAILVEPPAFPTEPGLLGETHFVGVSNGYQGISNLSLRGTVPGLRRLAWRLQGSLKKAGSLQTPAYDLDNTAVEELHGSAAAAYRTDRLFVSFGLSRFSNKNGVFTGLRSESPTDFFDAIQRDQPRNVELFDFSYDIERAFQDVTHLFARGEVTYRFDEIGEVRALYGYQRNDRREFDNVRASVRGAQLAFDLQTHTLELTLERPMSRTLSVRFGAAGRYQHNDHEGRRLMPDYDLWGGGIFALGRYATKGFEIEAGVRYELVTADTTEPARINPSQNPPLRRQLDFQATSASIAGRFSVIPPLTLEIQLAHAARIPTMNELFIDGPSQGQGTFETGDPSLDVERTYNASGGLAFSVGWLEAETTAYVHYIDDYIYFAPRLKPDGTPDTELTIAGAFPAFVYRAVDAVYAGANFELTLKPWSFLELRSRASLVRARNLSDDGFLLFIPADRIENRITVQTSGRGPLRRGAIFAQSVVTLRQSRVEPNTDFAEPPNGYHLIDLGGTATLEVLGQPLEVGLELQNLLNVRYRDYLSRLRYYADEPGRSAIVRVRVPFTFDWTE